MVDEGNRYSRQCHARTLVSYATARVERTVGFRGKCAGVRSQSEDLGTHRASLFFPTPTVCLASRGIAFGLIGALPRIVGC